MTYSIEIDKKWQKKWQDKGFYKFKRQNNAKKHYVCEMFSYPSGAKLHVGHWYNYSLSDSYARLKHMQGYNVFQPMGFDSFGLPAENYAIKTGIHPEISTISNMKTMQQQLLEMGAFFAWDHTLSTCDPSYYRWTQWLFLQLFKNKLAYRKNAPVNWCDSCQTVLANEQCEDGNCERCNNPIRRKNLTQWFFKITDYAEELLTHLDDLDWPEKTKKIQKNWIGKSEGAKIFFDLDEKTADLLKSSILSNSTSPNSDENKTSNISTKLEIFTTRPDTLMGVTYLVMAPEHQLALSLTTPDKREEVEAYIDATAKVSEIDRQATTRPISGVFTGSYVLHPITQEKIPIYLADYVIASYGTGIVMAVPAHDERDYRFASQMNLPIKTVIVQQKDSTSKDINLPFCEDGFLINSGLWDGLTSSLAKQEIITYLTKHNLGSRKINYRLRDWLVSRQRYWGAPIPVIHCPSCGIVPVPEKDLPVLLPKDVEFLPDGQSPLAKCESFVHVNCPTCGQQAKRDVDTLDTFVCSSWYYLRYADANNDKEAFNKDKINDLLPVDKYIGGAEHAAMHLLYARFITKALRDMGYVNFDEPFLSLIHQGTILGEDGQKMSKSLGNTISPDPYINEHGSDIFRLYLAFGFAYTEGGPWSDGGVKAIVKFTARLSRWFEFIRDLATQILSPDFQKNLEEPATFLNWLDQNNFSDLSNLSDKAKELHRLLHHSIKGVSVDAEKFQFNTSIARIMELSNELLSFQNEKNSNELISVCPLLLFVSFKMLQLIAPFAPHFAEEYFEKLSFMEEKISIFDTSWPRWDKNSLKRDFIEIAIQINSQIKARIEIPINASSEEVRTLAENDPTIKQLLENKNILKWIYIPGRIANFVIKK